MQQYQVTFQPGNVTVTVPEGALLKDVINDAGIDFDFPCGGKGRCGKCRIKVEKGAAQPGEQEIKHLSASEIEIGIRLACLTGVRDDLTVGLLSAKNVKHQILLTAVNRAVKLEPHIRKRYLEAEKPAVDDNRPDWQRLTDSLSAQGENLQEPSIPMALLRRLPETLRSSQFRITAVLRNNEVSGVEPGNTANIMLGMAFDIGTTTIVGYLLDLYTGEELSVVSILNPQAKYGADVISRTSYAGEHEDGLKKLNSAVVDEAINKLIGEAVEKAGVARDAVYAVAVVGNTVMQHLFLGVTPRNIALAPYVPAVASPLEVNPADLNIKINPAGKVFVLPNIAGYVGADTVAAISASELDRSDDLKLLIDIGTNGEIVLGTKDRLVACAAAAGPAFEGAQISSGMRGAVGAIDHVSLQPEFKYSVIGDARPEGICGSALLDIVAELVDVGIINKKGRLLPPEDNGNETALKYRDRVVEHDGSWAFMLVEGKDTAHGRPILLTQQDVRQLQLAKGAMAAGIQILMDTLGVTVDQITEVVLAGAFGNYLNPHSACTIGLIPRELENNVNMVGNAAGAGSKLALLSRTEFRRTKDISTAVDYVELSSCPSFTGIFAKAMYF